MKIAYVLSNKIFDRDNNINSLKHILYHFNKKYEIFPIIPFSKDIPSHKQKEVYRKNNVIVEKFNIFEDNLTYFSVKNTDGEWDFSNSESNKLFCDSVSDFLQKNILPDIVHLFGSKFGYLAKILKTKTIFNIDEILCKNQSIISLDENTGISLDYSPLIYGTIFADIVVMPSKNIILEIIKSQNKSDFKEILRKKYEHIYGIPNGIDYRIWNPKHDYLIPYNYSSQDFFNKNLCKSRLQKSLEFEVNTAIPLLIFGEEISEKSGFDIIKSELKYFSTLKLQLIIFGKTNEKYRTFFSNFNDKYQNIKFIDSPNEHFLHNLIASADIYISPAKVNINNFFFLKAMRYGVIPFTYNTGLYADTIVTSVKNPKLTNGFLYLNHDSASFISRLKEVLDVYKNRELWNSYIKNSMEKDYSWKEILKEYNDIYLR